MKRPRPAFTLVELLVVIAIIGILLGILLPVISKVRANAMATVCTARLRDLSLATMQFQQDHKTIPQPAKDTIVLPGYPQGVPIPHRISVELINELRPYFKQNAIASDLSVAHLSPSFQCPFVEGVETDRGPFLAGTDDAYYYTGYAYVGRLSETVAIALPGPTPASPPLIQLPIGLPINLPISLPTVKLPTLLKPARSASAKVLKRAPIWGDDIHYTQADQADGPCWTYWHRKRGTSPPSGVVPLSVKEIKPILGQNVAFTDGSVQWVPADELDFTVSDQATIDLKASFKVPDKFVWWF